MKSIFKTFTLIFCLALISVSCIKEELPVPKPIPTPETDRGQLVGILDSASYTCEEFADAINASPTFSYFGRMTGADNTLSDLLSSAITTLVNGRQPVLDLMFSKRVGLDKQLRRQWHIESYTFTYRSVDAMGNPITLAGRVTFPNNTVNNIIHEVSSLSLVSHQFLISQDWAPSNNLSLLSMRCLYNSAVIEPDYQGYGYDNLKHVHTVLSTNTMGRQMADCAMAAVALMNRHGVQLASDGIATNWGTSAGEPYAISFARYYDREASSVERATIPLKSTFANDGVLSFADLTVYQDEHPNIDLFYPQYVSAITALPTSVLHGYLSEQFFPEWMNTTMIEYNGMTASYLYWASRFVNAFTVLRPHMPDPSTVLPNMGMRLNADMLKDDGHINYESSKTQTFLQICREQMTFDDWTPQTEIYLGNEDEDSISPYASAYAKYLELRQRSDKVHWLIIDNSNSILRPYMNVHEVSSLESLLYMTLAPEPKDMRLIHREEL